MTAAIGGHHPGAEVRDVSLLLRDDGTNRRARFGLTYAKGSGPETVFVKAEAEAHRALHARNGNLFNEAELFASRVPLAVEHPLVYLAIVDRPHLDYVVVMEDLNQRGADPRDATRPLNVDQVANGLRGLAKLHAQYWAYDPHDEPKLGWVQAWLPTEGFQVGLRQRIPTGLERGGAAVAREIRAYSSDEIVNFWARFVSTLADSSATLLHGDAHIGNTYLLPDGTVGFLDWQVVRRGNWSQDVGYFLMGALTEDDRRHHERDLLNEYLTALDLEGVQRPSPEEAYVRYRASAAYGLAVWLSTLGSDGFQSRDISLALTQRYAAAFVDLKAIDALSDLDA
jgi:hypothetical protein